MSYADGGPTRTAVLRGQRSYADGSPARTAPEGLVPLDSPFSPAGGTGAERADSFILLYPTKKRQILFSKHKHLYLTIYCHFFALRNNPFSFL